MMNFLQTLIADVGRIGIGLVFLLSVALDFKARKMIFELMKKKHVPMPWLFFIGATVWKFSTSIALIMDFYTFWAASLLAIYIFLANLVFNNFWTVPRENRDFSMAMFLIHLSACFGLLVIAVR